LEDEKIHGDLLKSKGIIYAAAAIMHAEKRIHDMMLVHSTY